ncbi:Transcriptional regulatory protein DesR [Oenococcus sicerae]|nr:Transcriptional regulatory protein DesR [Oenococcus sicerae]
MIRVFLAEDQIMLNTALSGILSLESDINLVGNAVDGQKALSQIRSLKPDIAILDIEMPKMSGLDVAEALFKDSLSTCKIVILTTFAQTDYFARAVDAQVSAYLLKDSPSDELIDALHMVMQGRSIYAPELVTSLVDTRQNPLSLRETELLKLVDACFSTKEIAGQLFLSEGTVRNYMSTILEKLQASNRIAAIQIAKKHGWI